MKDKQGVLKTDKNDRMDRWEIFSEILNRDDPTNPIKEEDIGEVDMIEIIY